MNYKIEENSKRVIISDKDINILARKNSKADIICLNSSSKRKAVLEENSEVNFYEIYSENNESETNIELNGENSRTNCYSLILSNNNKITLKTNVTHKEKNTKSNLICKSVLNGKSNLNYSGNINMEKGAKNSEGYQKQDSLLLSQESNSISVPKLNILENDVKCSHGVTMSEIAEEQLFYLMSRGLNKKEAKNQIIQGFINTILEKIEEESIKNKVKQHIMEKEI